jgi:tRNA pseudouridine55 synthase
VVNKIRYTIKRKLNIKKIKVGHAGTLDPLATGLLIICTGKFTKRIEEFQAQEKEYTGTFYIGATTPSFDLETEIDQKYPTDHITEEMLKDSAHNFTGEIMQAPPLFSAIKIKGERAYNKARKNQDIKLAPRSVVINEFEIIESELPEITFRVKCSKGTYIRSLARDYGKSLKSGAYLSSLRRTLIGDFSVENAQSIEDMVESINESGLYSDEH